MAIERRASVEGATVGFLNVHKPRGMTSHDIVAAVRRRLPRKTKVGHAGTLDPFATGVLVLCVGQATRLASYVQSQPKRYAAEVTLGATSTTDDPEGEIAPTPGAEPVPLDEVRGALEAFVGEIDQVPPAHSAVHVGGRRAYKLAREGERPELPSRRVVVHAIELVRYDWPVVELDVRCGSGTYVRALARDIGRELGVGGYCSALARTEVGCFTLDAAVPLDALDPERHLISVADGLPTMPQVYLGSDDAVRLCQGQAVSVEAELPPAGAEVLAMGEGRAFAVCRVAQDGRSIQPHKVLARVP